LPDDATISVPQGSTDKAIDIKDASFSWNPSGSTPTLSDVHLSVVRGMRVAVCGVIGSGKSSLLSCILGEIPKLCGQVSTRMKKKVDANLDDSLIIFSFCSLFRSGSVVQQHMFLRLPGYSLETLRRTFFSALQWTDHVTREFLRLAL
jgi:ABC-type transport system involved in cytochrome bd biosynthesis fused ATPase/permease subunit